MGILVEFNPDLALRNISEYKTGKRQLAECIPADIKVWQNLPLFKKKARGIIGWKGNCPYWKQKDRKNFPAPKPALLFWKRRI